MPGSGAENPNWRGGRVVEPRGYVLLRMPDHPLSDCRGYVYEHRVVAEGMVGRPLLPTEEIHHGPGGKGDNRPENLTVCDTRWDHAQHHSSRPGRTRAPDEPNREVECACGCGTTFERYDSSGRPRRFVSGHNVTHDEDGRWTPVDEGEVMPYAR